MASINTTSTAAVEAGDEGIIAGGDGGKAVEHVGDGVVGMANEENLGTVVDGSVAASPVSTSVDSASVHSASEYEGVSAPKKKDESSTTSDLVLRCMPNETMEEYMERLAGSEESEAEESEAGSTIVKKAIQENCTETIPVFFQQVPFNFLVKDLNFSYVIGFVKNISPLATKALMFNGNLQIFLRFSDDTVTDSMITGLWEWLNQCKETNKLIGFRPSDGVRIPWSYEAYEPDQFAHIDTECRFNRFEGIGEELEREWKVIKAEFHEAAQRI